jgi:phage baseplate assembly protein W
MATDPSLDIDAATGADLRGFRSVLQSVEQIFATGFGDRVMREWFGSAVPRFLGESMNRQTILPFFAAISSAIEQWEPRLRVVQITPESLGRDGRLAIAMDVEYRPRALLGDLTPEGARRVVIAGGAQFWEARDNDN